RGAGIATTAPAPHTNRTAASLVHPDSRFVVAPRLALFPRRLAALPHQSRAIPRVRRAVVLLPVTRRTRNDLALTLLRYLPGQCPTAKSCEGRQQNKNIPANSHAILQRLCE